MSEKNCYIHDRDKAVNDCERCGYSICEDCSNAYWHTNTITAMFQAQRRKQEEMMLCNKCLRNIRIRSGLISGFLLILILGAISFFIVLGVT